MSRKRGRGRWARKGGALTSMRGGFKATVRATTGEKKATSPTRKFVYNLVTIALLVTAAVLLLRRFGVIN
jgi:hypothetical protein